MSTYDFSTLNDKDFEECVRDLLSKELKERMNEIRGETFSDFQLADSGDHNSYNLDYFTEAVFSENSKRTTLLLKKILINCMNNSSYQMSC